MGWNDHLDDEDGYDDDDLDYDTDTLKELLKQGVLSDVAAGITKQVIEKGEGSLSEKQQAVFEQQVKR